MNPIVYFGHSFMQHFSLTEEVWSMPTCASGWVEKELLETFYLIVQEYRMGAIGDAAFKIKIFAIADRYARYEGKEEPSRDQLTFFAP